MAFAERMLGKKAASWAVFAVSAALIALFLYKNHDVYGRLVDITLGDGAILLGLAACAPIFNAFKFYYTLNAYGYPFAFKECFALVSSCSLYNNILPANAGSVLRAIYLKKVFAFPYSRYLSLTVFANVVSLIVCLVIAVILLFFVDFKIQLPYLEWITLFALLMAFVGYLLLNHQGFRQLIRAKFDVLPDFDSRFFYGSVGLVSAHMIFVLFSALRLSMCFHVLGVDLSIEHYLLVHCVLFLTLIYNVTPGNIGVSESAIASLMLMFGVDVVTAFSAALLDRFLVVVVLGVYGMFSIGYLGKLSPPKANGRLRSPVQSQIE